MAAWSEEILVTNVIDSMKWNKSRQLAAYNINCCIGMVPSSPLLAGFAVEPIDNVTISVSKSRGGKFLGMAVLSTSSGLDAKIWVGQLKGLLMFLEIIFLLFTSTHCTPLNTQSDNIRWKTAWMPGLKYLQTSELAVTGPPLGLSTSDINNSNKIRWQ